MIYVLLPAYNEEENIGQLLEEIKAEFRKTGVDYHILVINDGSEDNTVKVAEKYLPDTPIEIISFVSNKGVGEVFRTGINWVCARAAGNDTLITLDCDRSHRVSDFAGLLSAIENGADIAIASRYVAASKTVGLPLARAVLSDGINTILKIIFRVEGVRDYTTFFRAYRMNVLKKTCALCGEFFIKNSGFSCMAEILIRTKIFKPRIKEIPITLRFDLRRGRSKMKVFKTISGYARLIWGEIVS